MSAPIGGAKTTRGKRQYVVEFMIAADYAIYKKWITNQVLLTNVSKDSEQPDGSEAFNCESLTFSLTPTREQPQNTSRVIFMNVSFENIQQLIYPVYIPNNLIQYNSDSHWNTDQSWVGWVELVGWVEVREVGGMGGMRRVGSAKSL